MIDNKLHFITRQLTKWYNLAFVWLQGFKAIIANYNAIFSIPVSSQCYGYAGNIVTMPFGVNQSIATPSTLLATTISRILPVTSSKLNPVMIDNIHSKTPKLEWVKTGNSYDGYLNGKWTGIYIVIKSQIYFTSPNLQKRGVIKIKPPVYAIKWYLHHCGDTIRIAEISPLRKAKQLAEEYYYVWSKVNTYD